MTYDYPFLTITTVLPDFTLLIDFLPFFLFMIFVPPSTYTLPSSFFRKLPWLSRQSDRLLTDRSLVRSQAEAWFFAFSPFLSLFSDRKYKSRKGKHAACGWVESSWVCMYVSMYWWVYIHIVMYRWWYIGISIWSYVHVSMWTGGSIDRTGRLCRLYQ